MLCLSLSTIIFTFLRWQLISKLSYLEDIYVVVDTEMREWNGCTREIKREKDKDTEQIVFP
jgi:hypothetical protein